MSVIAHVAHSSPGRTRLRVSSERGNGGYFSWAAQRLSECPGIDGVQANALTGSLLIRHIAPFSQIAAFAEDHQLFTLQADNGAGRSISHQAAANLAWVDTQLARLSAGGWDLRSVLFIVLLALSVVQIYRGQILIPASALLWNILQLLYWEDLKSEDTVKEKDTR